MNERKQRLTVASRRRRRRSQEDEETQRTLDDFIQGA
jgi:hypothetical protein